MKKRSQKKELSLEEREVLYNSIFFRKKEKKKADAMIDKLDGTVITYEKDEFVIAESERIGKIGIVLSGELCKVQHTVDGTELLMQTIKVSYVVGLEIAISEKQTSPYSVYAMDDSCIYWFSNAVFRKDSSFDLEERMWINQRIFNFLANENIRQYKKIEILSLKSARERIVKYLEIQSKRHHAKEFDIEFDREQMANYLGLNRSVLSHELKKMEKEGLLHVRKNHFDLFSENLNRRIDHE